MRKVNCIYSEKSIWCSNKLIKRSLSGFGSRCCIEYPLLNGKKCALKKEYPKPSGPPPVPPTPPPKRVIYEDISLRRKLNVFVFSSPRHNYGAGEYHFVAGSIKEATAMAKEFEKVFNVGKNNNYTIQLTYVCVLPIKKGYIDICRRTSK